MFYVSFFSKIGHKEARFLLPVWPFMMIVIGEFWQYNMRIKNRCVWFFAWTAKVYIVIEVSTYVVMETFFRGHWKVREALAEMEPAIHSAYLSEPLWTPHYNLMHR